MAWKPPRLRCFEEWSGPHLASSRDIAYLGRVTRGIAHGIDEPSEQPETAKCDRGGWVAETTKEDGEQGMRDGLECVLMGTLSAVELHRRWIGLGFRVFGVGYVGHRQQVIVSRNERGWRTGKKEKRESAWRQSRFGTEATK